MENYTGDGWVRERESKMREGERQNKIELRRRGGRIRVKKSNDCQFLQFIVDIPVMRVVSCPF